MLLKSLLLLGCVALIHGAALQEQEEVAETIVNILNEEQMAKFLAENPDAIKLNREVSIQGRADYTVYKLTWTLGARKSGDTNVYNGYSDYIWFEQASNPQIIVTYPKEGTGKVVTHVSIETKQSSTSGEAYVSAGGIGQRTIQFYVRGYNTIFYAWDINIYGQ